MRIIAIIGARPQFIKHFPFEKACEGKIDLKTIHTGQHYDENMSAVFFEQLGMKKPDYKLNIGSDSHGAQTAKMMIEIEEILVQEKPDGIVVYGDTNSTLAGALVASKIHIPIFHIEAGLRSFNKEMPEEINRILTDHISTCLFTPSSKATKNLQDEGIVKNVHEVGDIMKDLVFYVKENKLFKSINVVEEFYYATIHRPYNTDDKLRLDYILQVLNDLDKSVIMAIHPRTRKNIEIFNLKFDNFRNIKFIDPQSYLDNLSYLKESKGLITDSGGMQKEAYWLHKKCVTIRTETEWIETLKGGNNKLMFKDLSSLNIELLKFKSDWNDELYGNGDSSKKIVHGILNC
ncbi:UDP-N-acetylglucosamine 2-epimerase (non-hydrolyzing) [Tenacibaculum sp. SZ-18]|uniref:non-hydrolyzing UDP-N-acetylglucosamine 2-epimerase n=1 Tax=Tenacibaculum sp. SZ-18 TaxID=754423 RepID=UPI000C2CE7D6|nr:UDP-N-acetylglucosamine 2-epimerase (non-hydrolyzing) [Tenacibaculum sp. SZ-18]AUC14158.1 UDP-N-acetylglucosamine 2-epimerase (non-hydrolyzing) [Tenacibaculum sp. SZ-18]